MTARTVGPDRSCEEAYAACAEIAEGHYENFSVASRLLPRGIRKYMYAIYAFCRHTDDLGDEASGDRIALLEEWERELVQVYRGDPKHPIMIAIKDVVQRFSICDEPFRKLIHANLLDQGHVRFDTYRDLIRYCEHSAVPVGQMVLYLLGDRSPESRSLSAATCTALQLTNFWQDVARDFAMDRVYIPQEDMVRFGVAESDLASNSASPALKSLLRFEVNRTLELFEKGAPLVNRIDGRMRLYIALFSKSGLRVLKAIQACDYDVLSKRPTVTTIGKLWLAISTAARLAVLKRA